MNNYVPEHASHVKVPYAAAWGARSKGGREIITTKTWEKYMNNFLELYNALSFLKYLLS